MDRVEQIESENKQLKDQIASILKRYSISNRDFFSELNSRYKDSEPQKIKKLITRDFQRLKSDSVVPDLLFTHSVSDWRFDNIF